MREPLSAPVARKVIQQILRVGSVSFSGHALDEMRKDGLTTVDCVNVLRAGVVEPAEYERGSWRYRIHGGWIWVVAAFRSDSELVVVTAWRKKS
jgi:hypothetical protein